MTKVSLNIIDVASSPKLRVELSQRDGPMGQMARCFVLEHDDVLLVARLLNEAVATFERVKGQGVPEDK